MESIKRGVLLGLVLLLVMIALPAQATHWCAQTTVSVSPNQPLAGKTTTYAVTVSNHGTDTTSLSSVAAKFSWEGSWKTIGSGDIGPGLAADFPAGASPPEAGTHQVEVRATGTSSGDAFGTESDCTAVLTLTAKAAATPGLEAGFVGVAMVVAAVGVGARRKR